MNKIKRKTELYKLSIVQISADKDRIDKKELKQYIILSDFINYYLREYKHTSNNDRKVIKKHKGICFYIDDVTNQNNVNSVILKYIKFNKSTNVVDVDTLQSKYKKAKNEGDEERQHYLLKVYDNTNKGILVYEKITGAITIGMINVHINRAYKKWVRDTYSNEEEIKKCLLGYEISIEIIPSPNFIEEIEKMEKISLLKVTVKKEYLTRDEDILYSEDNISRDDVDILYKPMRTFSFSKSRVIKYFEMYQGKKEKVKRLVINGRKNGNSISLDTESMKLSEYIDANIDIDGLVNSKDIFRKYKDLLNQRFKEYIDDIINKEIILDIDNKEE